MASFHIRTKFGGPTYCGEKSSDMLTVRAERKLPYFDKRWEYRRLSDGKEIKEEHVCKACEEKYKQNGGM